MAYDARTMKTSALARLHPDGTARVESATCDQGTGSYTIMRQIAADTLGLPYDSIEIHHGDTAEGLTRGDKSNTRAANSVHRQSWCSCSQLR